MTTSILVNGTGTLTPITLKKNYLNSIGTDAVLAYDAEQQVNPTSTGKTTVRYYYHTNQLGSIIAISTSTGQVIQKYIYNAYGKAYIYSGSTLTALTSYTGTMYSNTRLYTGREYDREAGYYYLRARTYSPDLGRFISRDPIGQNDQVNLYTYVANSPLKYVDRMGREKILILLGVDYDGEEPIFDSKGYITNVSDLSPTRQLFNTIKKQLDSENRKFDYKFIKNFDDFDKNINEKERETIVAIFHGNPNSIAINGEISLDAMSNPNSFITDKNLDADTQTKRLKNTYLSLYSCNTGNMDSTENPIGKKIQDHYGFKTTYAPTKFLYENGDIYDTVNSWPIPIKREGFMRPFN
ncbi:RHS repeat-associated core domain-containing protein [Candidatus Gracilibacteria bacterium]|nr:RHS repeat-associated core domain-containing protein [Candidatus Gracilibacteria bacterium]